MIERVDCSSVSPYCWGEGCEGWRLVDQPGVSVIEERVPPGGLEQWHLHETARQFFYVLAGGATVRLAEGDVVLGSGQGVEVPAGVAHQFTNPTGSDVRFLVVSVPSTRDDRIDLPEPLKR